VDDLTGNEVGYGKPPKSRQFRAGQSGNPKGRPKGSRNLLTIIQKDGEQRVRVSGSSGSRLVTKKKLVISQVGNKAAQGDLAAARFYLSLQQQVDAIGESREATQSLNEQDAASKKSFLARFAKHIQQAPAEASKKEGSDREPR